jgi:hypothetical protein
MHCTMYNAHCIAKAQKPRIILLVRFVLPICYYYLYERNNALKNIQQRLVEKVQQVHI